MFTNSFNHIKNSVRSGFVNLKLLSSESMNIPIITDPYARQITTLHGSKILLRTPVHYKFPAIKAPGISGGSTGEFDSTSSLSSEHSEQATPFLDASSSSDSIYTTPLSPNSRLFRGSQDEFGFDVYITHYGYHRGPAYLFECPTVLPWDELVVALAAKAGREAKAIVLSSKFYPGIVNDTASYQEWLAWSRKNDGPCSTDLWLA